MSRDHRGSERHRVRFKLIYDDGNSFNAGWVVNVSETGVFLETALPLPTGTTVRLTPLDKSGEQLFEVGAKVVRSMPYDPTSVELAGMGLQFLDLADEDKRNVAEMIRMLQERTAAFHGELDPFLGVLLPSIPPSSPPDPQGGDEGRPHAPKKPSSSS